MGEVTWEELERQQPPSERLGELMPEKQEVIVELEQPRRHGRWQSLGSGT